MYLILFLKRPPRTHLPCYTGPSGKTNLYLQHSWSFQGGKTQDIFPVARVSEPVCLSAWFSPPRTPRCDRPSTALLGMTSFISGGSACNFKGTGCCSGPSQLQVSVTLQVLLQWTYSAVTVWPGPMTRTERPHRSLIKNTVCWPSNTVLIMYTITFPPMKA